jgi:hypothetical protein
MGRPRIAEEQSATFVVNLPELGYKGHVERIVRLLQTYGYRAIPMSGEFVLEMAADVRRQLDAAQAAQHILEHAATNRPTDDGDQTT